MSIVLAEVTAALDALQGAGGLVAEVVGDLADAHGQITVGVGTICVDHHVVGAVHRAQHIALALHLHGGEHVLTVVTVSYTHLPKLLLAEKRKQPRTEKKQDMEL